MNKVKVTSMRIIGQGQISQTWRCLRSLNVSCLGFFFFNSKKPCALNTKSFRIGLVDFQLHRRHFNIFSGTSNFIDECFLILLHYLLAEYTVCCTICMPENLSGKPSNHRWHLAMFKRRSSNSPSSSSSSASSSFGDFEVSL